MIIISTTDLQCAMSLEDVEHPDPATQCVKFLASDVFYGRKIAAKIRAT